jgi:hypothetical protein
MVFYIQHALLQIAYACSIENKSTFFLSLFFHMSVYMIQTENQRPDLQIRSFFSTVNTSWSSHLSVAATNLFHRRIRKGASV